MEPDPRPEHALTIDLLDRASGHPVQTWRLGQPVVRIGRARECDVAVADPYVSRQHAELRFADGCWQLISTSTRGLLIRGERTESRVLADSLVFRLGPGGPELHVRVAEDFAADLPTMSVPTLRIRPIQIDEARKTEDVAAIAESDSFKALLDKARRLRERR